MSYKNNEGYSDPTAGKAMKAAGHMPDHVFRDYCVLRAVAYRLGLEIAGIRERKSKKEWKIGG